MSGPLDGIRVLELSTVVLGPWACQILGDYGADVIKVEPPTGDSNRHVAPARHPLMGVLFLTCNRNKRSVVLDLKHPDGREAVLALAARSDVLVHNFRPSSLTRLGLSYEAVRAVSPRIVYCGTYGYSRLGPYGETPAYDDSIQAASGVAMLAARMEAEPRYLPTILADKSTALTVVGAISSALFHRERTGRGQEVEVPMFESTISFLCAEHLMGLAFDPPDGPPGYMRLLTEHRRPYRTRDGFLAVLPYLDEHWTRFCAVAGRPDLAADPRFATLAARSVHIADVYEEVARVVATRTTQEWLAGLASTGVPVTRVNDLEDLLTDAHLEATGFWQVVEHPTEGRMRTPAIPARFFDSPGSIRRPPPRLGEHSREVLSEVGYSDERIAALFAAKVTSGPPE